MRVELVYNPECSVYKSIHKVLEDVIAEERWPIPVEMVEDKVHSNSPYVRLDGNVIMKIKHNQTFESLRDFLFTKWTEITNPKKFHSS